ncbi:FeS assembly SUF system protein SufT [Opitutaceae bacterium TAV5]|nr:FeS assembly SUF system protein SufT [Opitutaceae bacterium TAV5]
MSTRLLKETPATAIPAGDAAALPAGTAVDVVQTLGGNVTLRTDRGLFLVSRENADAIAGFELSTLGPVSAAAPASGGVFSEQAVWDVLKTCFDPEIPVNIVDLGLIYDLSIEKSPANPDLHTVEVKMTLTAPGCGMGPVIAEDARQKIAALPAVESAKVHIVWDPVWNPQMISEAGRQKLGLE